MNRLIIGRGRIIREASEREREREIWLEIFIWIRTRGRRKADVGGERPTSVSLDRIDSSNRAAVTLFPLEQTLFSARRSLNRVIIGGQRFSTLLNSRKFRAARRTRRIRTPVVFFSSFRAPFSRFISTGFRALNTRGRGRIINSLRPPMNSPASYQTGLIAIPSIKKANSFAGKGRRERKIGRRRDGFGGRKRWRIIYFYTAITMINTGADNGVRPRQKRRYEHRRTKRRNSEESRGLDFLRDD